MNIYDKGEPIVTPCEVNGVEIYFAKVEVVFPSGILSHSVTHEPAPYGAFYYRHEAEQAAKLRLEQLRGGDMSELDKERAEGEPF